MTSSRRLLKTGLAATALLLAVAAGALLSLPLWIDAAAVKRQIAARVHEATGDTLELDRLRMPWFRPASVEVSGPRYRADNLQVAARSLTVDLDAWGLLTGAVRPRSIRLSGVDATLTVPDGPEGPALTIAEAERRLREATQNIARALPGLDASIEDSRLTVRLSGQEPLVFDNLDASVRSTREAIHARVEGRSAFWRKLSLEVHLAASSLEGQGLLQFDALDAAALARRFAAAPAWRLTEAELIGRLEWKSRGLSKFDGEFLFATPRLSVQNGKAGQAFEGVTAAGAIAATGKDLAVRVHRMYVRSPRALLAGEFTQRTPGTAGFRIEADAIDLLDLQQVARNLAPDAAWLSNPPVALRAGTLQRLDLQGEAGEPQRLFELAALRGEAVLDGVSIDLRNPALRIDDAAGAIGLEHGMLKARRVSATVEGSRIHEGQLDAQLADAFTLERAQAFVNLDIGAAARLSRRLIAQEDVTAQLDALEKIDGKALAHVRLARQRGGLETEVDLSHLALFVRHKFVPLPLRLDDATFRFAKGMVSLKEATGQFGRSAFRGLEASLDLSAPQRFQVRQREGHVVLEEMFTALRQIPAAAPALKEIHGLTGTATISDASVEGELSDLAALRFIGAIQLHDVKALSPRLDADVLLDGGPSMITDRSIDIRDLGVRALDASLRIGATTGDYRKGLQALELTADGQIGPTALERMQSEAAVPPQFRLRAPLRLSAVSGSWKRGGDIALRGNFNMGDRTDLSVAAKVAGGKVRIERARLKDAGTDALFSGEFATPNFDIAFKGKLVGDTIAAIFVQPPLALGSLSGDLAAGLHLGQPWVTHAQGRLSAQDIDIPGAGMPLRVERVALSAANGRISVDHAAAALGESHLEFKGDVWRDGDKLALDADLKADRVVVPTPAEPAEPAQEKPFHFSDLAVKGRLGVDIGRMESEKATLTPLVADVRIDGDLLNLRILRAALCNINMSGTLEGGPEDMKLAGSLSSSGADVEKTIACLTGGRVVLSGVLDVDARFTSSGRLGELAKRVDGSFTAKARDGRVEQFDTLNRIFAFLNLTEVVRGEKLQLGERGLPYRTVDLKGTLKGEVVHLDELTMDGPTVHIVAMGHVDYGTSRLGMDVLVAPLQTANVLMNKIPLVERIFGGAVLALPVQVSGTIQGPIVVPLGPGTVAKRMTSIIANTLKLPLDAVKTVTPATGAQEPPKSR